MDWSTCSPDIILLIFKLLDHNTLVKCLTVCKLWRDVVDYIGQTNSLWKKLAQDAMHNKGITFSQKSTLSWRDMYFNSLLWKNRNTYFQHDKTLPIGYIKNIHIFKDNIIIVRDSNVEYRTVESLTNILEKPNILDCQESDHIIVELIARNKLSIRFKHNHTTYNVSCCDFKLVDDRCFVINTKNVIWLYKCCDRRFIRRPLMRSYDYLGSIYDINIYKNDIYILKQNGNVLHGEDWELKTETVAKIATPNFFNSPLITMFHKHSVVYSVPRGIGPHLINIIKIGDSEDVILEYPGLTCATPHGEVLLLGYEDGGIGIYYLNKITNDNNANILFNINAIAGNTLEEPAVKAIEVYELKGAHYLFIATRCTLFKVILNHSINQ